MNNYLSIIFLAIAQLYRQLIDAKYVVDTNILTYMSKDLQKILKFTEPQNVNKPEYAPVAAWARTPEGQKFFEDYEPIRLLLNISPPSNAALPSINFKPFWNFIAVKHQELVSSGLMTSEKVDDLFKIANAPTNQNDMVRVNGITYGEYFEGRSFKVGPSANRNGNTQLVQQQWKLKIFKDAPGLEIPQSPILPTTSQNEIPEQALNQPEIETKLEEFWQKIGDLNYHPASGSYGEMLQKFYNDVTTGNPSAIKSTAKNIIDTMQSYGPLRASLMALVKSRIEETIKQSNPNITRQELTAQVKYFYGEVEKKLKKNYQYL